MSKLPSWKTIASDLDVECAYLARRCLEAEGKDPDDRDAMVALLAYAQEAARQ